jgi:citrate lyase subunit beta/citryl-CoA lyase
VPGAEPRKLERAREATADTLLFDLEDSVTPDRKTEARRLVAGTLRSGGFGDTEVAVRVNAPATVEFDADLEAVVAAGARTIMLSKCDDPQTLARVTADLDRRLGGIDDIRLLLLIESAAGIANAVQIARGTPRAEALCFGHADFALEMGLRDADASTGILHHARCGVVIAAKACGLAPIDSAHLSVRDEAAFRADAELGLRLGFEGKLCIHPKQAEIANAVYTPSRADVERAMRVIDAAEKAKLEGRGVFTLDGRMIDAPVIAVERRVLDRARRAGVLST